MAISDILNRRVRARPEEDDDLSEVSASDEGSQAGSDAESNGSIQSEVHQLRIKTPKNQTHTSQTEGSVSGSDDEEENDTASEASNGNDTDLKATLAEISFGALAKAQSAMSGDKKRKSKHAEEPNSSLDEIRSKLREAREAKEAAAKKVKSKESKARTSKHAPMEMSSKRAVTRRRTAVELPPAPKARDPRFDAAVMGHSGVGKHAHGGKAYAFLDEYRADELKGLKEALGKTKNPDMREKLKAQIRTATDKMRSAANKKREEDVRAEHKAREKQLIREGKKAAPYYLKNSELKKQVLEKKFGEMGSRERSKALERRRKKTASKEKKEMPWERRGFEGGGGGGDMPNGGKRRRLE
jgi:ribosomal RNA-processing protein 36